MYYQPKRGTASFTTTSKYTFEEEYMSRMVVHIQLPHWKEFLIRSSVEIPLGPQKARDVIYHLNEAMNSTKVL